MNLQLNIRESGILLILSGLRILQMNTTNVKVLVTPHHHHKQQE